jgi:hypothetical protein
MGAKTMNIIVTNPRSALMASDDSFARAAPVTVSTPSGTAASSRSVTVSSLTPSSAATVICS